MATIPSRIEQAYTVPIARAELVPALRRALFGVEAERGRSGARIEGELTTSGFDLRVRDYLGRDAVHACRGTIVSLSEEPPVTEIRIEVRDRSRLQTRGPVGLLFPFATAVGLWGAKLWESPGMLLEGLGPFLLVGLAGFIGLIFYVFHHVEHESRAHALKRLDRSIAGIVAELKSGRTLD